MVEDQVATCNLASYYQEASNGEPVTSHDLQGAQILLSFTQGHTSHPEMQCKSSEECVEMQIMMNDSDQDEDSDNNIIFLEPYSNITNPYTKMFHKLCVEFIKKQNWALV
jgi:hypothetical protein